jgi:hypothetical protein
MLKRETPSDLGLATVEYLRARYQPEKEWSDGRARGFRWWPAELEHEVWAEPAWDDDGIVIWRVHARTDVLCEVEDQSRAVAWLAYMAREGGSLSAPVLEDGGRVRLASSLYVHDQNLSWTQPLLAWIGLLQVHEARLLASAADAAGIGRAAWSAHPVTGPRSVPDELTTIVRLVVLPRGEQPSAFAGPDMEECLAFLQRPQVVLATGDGKGVTAELPFGSRTSLTRLLPGAEHPLLGWGLLVLLSLPVDGDDPLLASSTAGSLPSDLRRPSVEAGCRTRRRSRSRRSIRMPSTSQGWP